MLLPVNCSSRAMAPLASSSTMTRDLTSSLRSRSAMSAGVKVSRMVRRKRARNVFGLFFIMMGVYAFKIFEFDSSDFKFCDKEEGIAGDRPQF